MMIKNQKGEKKKQKRLTPLNKVIGHNLKYERIFLKQNEKKFLQIMKLNQNKTGSGGYGTIHPLKILDEKYKKHLRIKPRTDLVVKISKKLNESSIQQYWEEYCFLKYFESNINIVNAYDFKYIQKFQQCWMIIESLPTDLYKLLIQRIKRKHFFTEIEVVSIGVKLLKIIQRLHLNGIYHSDIKPENFMFSNILKCFILIDFGTSQQLLEKDIYVKSKGCSDYFLPYHLQKVDMVKQFWKIRFTHQDLSNLDSFSLCKMFLMLLQKNEQQLELLELDIKTDINIFDFIEKMQENHQLSDKLALIFKSYLIEPMSKTIQQLINCMSNLIEKETQENLKFDILIINLREVRTKQEIEKMIQVVEQIGAIYSSEDYDEQGANIRVILDFIKKSYSLLNDQDLFFYLSWISQLFLQLCKNKSHYFSQIQVISQRIYEIMQLVNSQTSRQNPLLFHTFHNIKQMDRILENWRKERLLEIFQMDKQSIKQSYENFKHKNNTLEQILNSNKELASQTKKYFIFCLQQEKNQKTENQKVQLFVEKMKELYNQNCYQQIISQSTKIFQSLIYYGKLEKADTIYQISLKSLIQIKEQDQSFFQLIKNWISQHKTSIVLKEQFREIVMLYVKKNLNSQEKLNFIFMALHQILEFLKQNCNVKRGGRLMWIYKDIRETKSDEVNGNDSVFKDGIVKDNKFRMLFITYRQKSMIKILFQNNLQFSRTILFCKILSFYQ